MGLMYACMPLHVRIPDVGCENTLASLTVEEYIM